MDFDFGSEAEADGAIGEMLPSDDEQMFVDEDAVGATPELPDESLDLELELFDAEPEAADLEATEMYTASGERSSQHWPSRPAFSEEDASASLRWPRRHL